MTNFNSETFDEQMLHICEEIQRTDLTPVEKNLKPITFR